MSILGLILVPGCLNQVAEKGKGLEPEEQRQVREALKQGSAT